MLSLDDNAADLLSIDNLTKLSKELKVVVHFFTINYREIEQVDTVGRFAQEVCIGRIKHRNLFVVASQLPEYSSEERALREVRGKFASTVQQLLEVFDKNSEEIAIESNSKMLKEKEAIAR
jgi:hypothetical protein